MSTPDNVARDLIGFGIAASAEVHAVVVAHTAILHRGVVARSSGRPGPNVVTGDHRRGINRRVFKHLLSSEGSVGSNDPQSRRLELGFTGQDSLGRNYDQPPFPAFGPALDAVAPSFEAAIALIPGKAARGLKPLPSRPGDIA